MALIINGNTIPTNVASALIYDGVSLTNLIYNGINV